MANPWGLLSFFFSPSPHVPPSAHPHWPWHYSGCYISCCNLHFLPKINVFISVVLDGQFLKNKTNDVNFNFILWISFFFRVFLSVAHIPKLSMDQLEGWASAFPPSLRLCIDSVYIFLFSQINHILQHTKLTTKKDFEGFVNYKVTHFSLLLLSSYPPPLKFRFLGVWRNRMNGLLCLVTLTLNMTDLNNRFYIPPNSWAMFICTEHFYVRHPLETF